MLTISKMNNFRNVVIVGGENGNTSRFATQIGPIKLDNDYEMAITSICHGEVFNIHSGNNKVYFYLTATDSSLESVKRSRGLAESPSVYEIPDEMDRYSLPSLRQITVPEGSYESAGKLCWTISNLISDLLGMKKRDAMYPTVDKQYNMVNIELENIYLVIRGKKDSPWTVMDVHEDQYERFTITNQDFHCSSFPVFVYANIIENSYINGKLTRNLGIVPVTNAPQWSFYESSNPNYVPINIKEFTNILIELRDINGQYIRFNPIYKTVITLTIKPIKRL